MKGIKQQMEESNKLYYNKLSEEDIRNTLIEVIKQFDKALKEKVKSYGNKK